MDGYYEELSGTCTEVQNFFLAWNSANGRTVRETGGLRYRYG